MKNSIMLNGIFVEYEWEYIHDMLYIYIYIHMYTCVYVYMYIIVYIYIYIFGNIIWMNIRGLTSRDLKS